MGEDLNLKYSNKSEVLKSSLLGFLIGLAIIVPGVSGAAFAIIFKLYEKILFAISNLLKKFKSCILFLLPLVFGGIIGIICGFISIKYLLTLFPFVIISLFAGLMLGSYPMIYKQIDDKRRTFLRNFIFVIGFIIPFIASIISIKYNNNFTQLNDLKLYHYFLFIAVGYLIAITQIVPGLSATSLLMIMGLFSPLISLINKDLFSNVSSILLFLFIIIGFVLGLVTFSKLMSSLLSKYKTNMFNFISGLSLATILTMFINVDTYSIYKQWFNDGLPIVEFITSIILFLLGTIISYNIVKIENKA